MFLFIKIKLYNLYNFNSKPPLKRENNFKGETQKFLS